jgi:single-stranded DNA-binding protein
MDVAGINHVLVLGRVGTYGVSLRHQSPDCATFLLAVPESGKDGKTYVLRLPVEIWGSCAQDAMTLSAGQLVMVEGKLRRRKRPNDEWEIVISSFEATPGGPAVAGDPRQGTLFNA